MTHDLPAPTETDHPFLDVLYEAPDPIFALKAAFDADLDPRKINLGPGAYLDDNAKPWILSSVAAAEEHLRASPPGHEYLPILGLPTFCTAAARVIWGHKSALIDQKRIATVQTISGTGAVHLALLFVRDFYPSSKTVFVSNPSWSNHRIMSEFLGLDTRLYPYYNATDKSVDFNGMIETMRGSPLGSVWILHPCAHNPTGCDLSKEQWKTVGEVMRERRLLPILDSAYQGFASGDLDEDAWAIRYLTEELELPAMVCQSFSKSMGLYGERVGAVHVTVPASSQGGSEAVRNIESQIGWLSRKEISVPPRYGATIAATILNTPRLFAQWQGDLLTMSGRIADMRRSVVDGLAFRKTPGNWDHVVSQIGMFSFTGLTRTQVRMLREKHIYLSDNGRISLSGLNTGNIEYFCDCVDEVVRIT